MPTRLDVFTPASGFGALIREARLRQELTLTEFAVKLGVSRPTVGNWERGRSQPRPKLLTHIADITGIRLAEMVTAMTLVVNVESVFGYRWHCTVCEDRGPILYGDDAKVTAQAEGHRHSRRHEHD